MNIAYARTHLTTSFALYNIQCTVRCGNLYHCVITSVSLRNPVPGGDTHFQTELCSRLHWVRSGALLTKKDNQ